MRKTTKFLLTLAVVCVSAFVANAADTTSVKVWNFTSWSEATLTNLNADTALAQKSWTPEYKGEGESRYVSRYKNAVTISTATANGVVIAELEGLVWPALTSGNLNLRTNYGDDGVQTGSTNKIIKIAATTAYPKAGQLVRVTLKTAKSGEARGISEITNMTGAVGADTYKMEEYSYLFTVAADEEVSFKYNAGIILKKIEILEKQASVDPVDPVVVDTIHYLINENFSDTTLALPSGWSAAKYTKFLTNAMNGASVTSAVDKKNLNLSIVGSGGGDRGGAVAFPSTGKAERVNISFNWFSGNPGTEANKMVELSLQDSLGNSILYFYGENWSGVANHFHCLNLDKSVVPGGAFRDVPAVAIAANKSTLVGPDSVALVLNSYWYTISATVNFASKIVETLTIKADTLEYTYSNLPFISENANDFSRINAVTFRNASANSNGTGTSGNGSSAYLAFQIDSFRVWNALVNNPIMDEGYLLQTDTLAGGKFPIHSDYFYTMEGFKKEYFGNGFYYNYADGNISACGSSFSTTLPYLWDITPSMVEGEYYIRSVSQNAYMSAFVGAEYSGVTLGETPVSFIMDFIPNTTVGQKGNATTQLSGNYAFSDYAAFRIHKGSSHILIRGGGQWRKGQNTQTRCDFIEFLYAYPKLDAYKSVLPAKIAEAKAIDSRTITEGAEAWNYKTGVKSTVSQAISFAEVVDTTSWARMEYAYNKINLALAAYKDGFALPAGKYTFETPEGYIASDSTLSADVNSAMLFDLEKDSISPNVFIKSNLLYWSLSGLGEAVASFEPIIDNGKVIFVSGSDTLKFAGKSLFTIAEFKGDVLATPKKYIPAKGATAADTSDIIIVFDQKIQLLDATKITLNGAQATVMVSNDSLIISDAMTIKTNYELIINKGALANASKATLVIDSIGVNFRTFSPYLRDSQTMLGKGFGGVYALFGPGSANGYLYGGKQIAMTDEDSLYCGLNGLNTSMWKLAVLDSTAKTWSVQNYDNDKYLSYGMDSMLVLSSTPTPWQISLNASAPSDNDYMNVYTFWPFVEESNAFYDHAINVENMKVRKSVANGAVTTVNFRVCIMETLSKADINTSEEFMTIGARNTGYVWTQSGSTITFVAIPENPIYSHWFVLRDKDGRYTFKNRATGDYATYVNDSTVSALPYDKDLYQSWVIMDHCSKDANNFYTVQGVSLAITADQTACAGKIGLSARNGGNASGSQGLARTFFKTAGVSFIGTESAPVVTVPSVTDSTILLNWTSNQYAASYQVKYGSVSALAYDSIKTDSIIGLVDSLAMTVKVEGLSYSIGGLEKNTTMYFEVTALSKGGLQGVAAFDSATTVSFADFTPPAPVAVDSLSEMKAVAFAWAKNESATKYILTYSLKDDMTESTSVEIAELMYKVINVPANTKVYATLTLKNASGIQSKVSPVGFATSLSYSLLTPSAPVVDSTSIKNTSMSLSWNAATDAVSYKLRISRSRTGVVNAEPIDVPGTTYLVENLSKGANYYFTIQAVNANGDLSSQSEYLAVKTTNVDAIDPTTMKGITVYTASGVLYIQVEAATEMSIYNLVGQKVRDIRAEEGLNKIEGLESGRIYMVRVQSNVIKVIL